MFIQRDLEYNNKTSDIKFKNLKRFKNTLIGIFYIDLKGNIFEISDSILDLFKIKAKADIINTNISEFFPKVFLDKVFFSIKNNEIQKFSTNLEFKDFINYYQITIIPEINNKKKAQILIEFNKEDLKLKEKFEYHIQLENTLSEITKLIISNNIFQDNLNKMVNLIAKSFKVIYCGVYLFNSDNKTFSKFIESTNDLKTNEFNFFNSYPWFFSKLKEKNIYCINDIKKIPPDKAEKELLKAHEKGIQSSLTHTIKNNQKENIGFLIILDNKVRDWSTEEINVLDVISDIFSGYIQKNNDNLKLIESEKQLKSAQQIANLGSWEWDLEKDKITWSDELYNIYGLNKEQQEFSFEYYKNFLHHPEDKDFVLETIKNSLQNKKPFSFEHRIIRPNGEIRYVFGQGDIVLDKKGNVIKMMGTSHDITNRKLIEIELQNSYEKLEKRVYERTIELEIANKKLTEEISERKKIELDLAKQKYELENSNKELEQFAYIASHDLQEPLRMIASYVQLLRKRYQNKLDSNADEYIDFVVSGVKRMKNMLQGLLNYSKIDKTKFKIENCNINKVINEVISNLSISIKEKNVQILFENLPIIKANQNQMIQLFQNLISNSIKYSKSNEIPQIEINYKKEDNYYIFSVKDNGIGIESKYFDRIFILYQRLHTRSEMEGNGIGLAICRKIVENYHGKLWIESEKGKGSTFYFSIKSD